MHGSKLYLGADAAYEAQQRGGLNTELSMLHRHAQRVAWGIIMAERVGIDLDHEVAALLRRCGDHFAAHVGAAFARRAQRRDTEAAAHLERARSLLPTHHPWAFLVPDDAKWNETVQPTLEEDEPGRVYRVLSDNVSGEAVLNNRGVGRFLRLRSGELVYINPVQLPTEIAEQVRALGEVTHIIAPSTAHSDYMPLALSQFPGARAFGVAGHRDYSKVAHIAWSGYLDDDTPLFPNELDQVTARGSTLGDCWLIDRASRTLIVTDAFFFPARGGESLHFRSAFTIFYAWAWGAFDRVGVLSYQPSTWTNIGEYQASIRRLLGHDFDHAASCHGSWRSLDGDARATMTRELGWVLDLGKLDGLGLLANFALRHPGVFLQLCKEELEERRSRRAAASAA